MDALPNEILVVVGMGDGDFTVRREKGLVHIHQRLHVFRLAVNLEIVDFYLPVFCQFGIEGKGQVQSVANLHGEGAVLPQRLRLQSPPYAVGRSQVQAVHHARKESSRLNDHLVVEQVAVSLLGVIVLQGIEGVAAGRARDGDAGRGVHPRQQGGRLLVFGLLHLEAEPHHKQGHSQAQRQPVPVAQHVAHVFSL